jgi:hypothetical protein
MTNYPLHTIHDHSQIRAAKNRPRKTRIFRENHNSALKQDIKNRQKTTPAKWSNNSQAPINAEPNRPHARNVLNNSTTTIHAKSRKIRHRKTPHCAIIQPEKEQQFTTAKSIKQDLHQKCLAMTEKADSQRQ